MARLSLGVEKKVGPLWLQPFALALPGKVIVVRWKVKTGNVNFIESTNVSIMILKIQIKKRFYKNISPIIFLQNNFPKNNHNDFQEDLFHKNIFIKCKQVATIIFRTK